MKHHGYTDLAFVHADTQFLIREALRALLTPLSKSFRSVSTAAALHELLEAGEVDVLVADCFQPHFLGVNDLATIRQQYSELKIVVLTNTLTPGRIRELHDSGIRAIVLKSDQGEELFQAIDAALKNRKHYAEEVLEILLKHDQCGGESPVLTMSEIDIVRLIASGLSTKEIAAKKCISFHTVMTHRKNIFRKLGVSSSPELLITAIKAGFIDNIEYHI